MTTPLRRAQKPGVAAEIGQGRADGLLPGGFEIAHDASLVYDDAAVLAATAGIDVLQ